MLAAMKEMLAKQKEQEEKLRAEEEERQRQEEERVRIFIICFLSADVLILRQIIIIRL